jgi:hypothetical protein
VVAGVSKRVPLTRENDGCQAVTITSQRTPFDAILARRQLDKITGEVLATAWAAGAGSGYGPLTVEVDSTICGVHGNPWLDFDSSVEGNVRKAGEAVLDQRRSGVLMEM